MNRLLDFLRNISGISTPIGGLQWDNRPKERDIIYEMLQSLGDRRLIRHYHGGFEYAAVVRSCEIIRQDITDALKKLRPESKVRGCLEEMRKVFHLFQTLVEEHYPRERFPYDTKKVNEGPTHDEVLTSLIALRRFVGTRLSQLSSFYDISLSPEMSYQYEIVSVHSEDKEQIPKSTPTGDK